jgi:type VI secretion system protein
VLAHLQVLLNARRGESLSAPEIGLIDFADVVHGFPASAQVLVQTIRAMILKHEPRLRKVAVYPVESDDDLVLAFEISALFVTRDRGPLRVRTELSSSGHFSVRES